MKSNIYTTTKNNIIQASKLIKSGKLVAFPTETIYGLGANALLPEAVKKIFTAKKRPMDNPLICHLGKKSQISKYAYIDNDIQKLLIKKLMPGPFTLLLRPKHMIPAIITAWQPLMSIRIPDNSICKQLLSLCDVLVAAPSANLSTKPSPTTAEMVYHNFRNKIPMILDGWESEVGIESTVVRVENNQVHILRPGFITKEDIEKIVGRKIKVMYTQKGKQVSPWTRYKHYAPKAKVQIFTSFTDFQKLYKKTKKIWLIATDEFLEKNKKKLAIYKLTTYQRWTKKNLITCAKNLFKTYHQCDKDKQNLILIEALPEKWIGYAIMNRIKKSISE